MGKKQEHEALSSLKYRMDAPLIQALLLDKAIVINGFPQDSTWKLFIFVPGMLYCQIKVGIREYKSTE